MPRTESSLAAAGRRAFERYLDELADRCFMPLTIGGGIRSADDVGRALRAGADKVSINSAAVRFNVGCTTRGAISTSGSSTKRL